MWLQLTMNIFELFAFVVVLFCGIGLVVVFHPATWYGCLGLLLIGCGVPVLGYWLFWRFVFKPKKIPR